MAPELTTTTTLANPESDGDSSPVRLDLNPIRTGRYDKWPLATQRDKWPVPALRSRLWSVAANRSDGWPLTTNTRSDRYALAAARSV